MDFGKFINILSGRFNDLPKEKSRVVRIFLSSTFTDTHEERDYLIQNIYPKLRNYAKLNYGLDFQILDMRWGISSEVTNTHMATTICLNEIKTSQKLSAGPNFITLLSHRYGTRCLPTRILADEFEIIKAELVHHPELNLKFNSIYENVEIVIDNLILDCYELDENETPKRYRLKYISRIIKKFNPKDKQCTRIWDDIETMLGSAIRTLADICYEKKIFTKTQHERYFVSVTEKEIFNGVLNAKNVENNVLYFVREIEDIKNYIDADRAIAWRFIDVDSVNRIDEGAQALLDDLKYNKVPKKVPESNIFRFKVKWAPGEGVKQTTHPDYMKEFGKTFYEQVKRLIDKNQSEKSAFENLEESDTKLLQEVLEHAYFCNECVEKFHGRNDLLTKLKDYLMTKSQSPLIIYGPSGCGKTAILGKLTSQILKIVPDPANYSIILRFLGTTPTSSNIVATFNSVIQQIGRIYNLKTNPKPLLTPLEVRDYLMEQLVLISSLYPNKKLVIVLDSIDQLDPRNYNLDWFISLLPENVKMIYSTLPDHENIFATLMRNKALNAQNFLEITMLDKIIAKEILDDWLKRSKRSISSKQWDVLSEMLKDAKIYPLYVKLIYDIVCKWPSFEVPDKDFIKCLNIDLCIKYLFKLLEIEHGKVLFERTVIYMTAFQNGITESEIEDILSLDDEVLYNIFEFHEPPVRRLPGALWSRIKYDLSGYLVEKEIDDAKVLQWYHRRFIEVSNETYISSLNTKNRMEVFSNVVDFFNETWKNKPKPYLYNDYLTKKKKLASNQSEAIRDTGMQPTIFKDSQGRFYINKRKIRELPQFISQLTSNLALVLGCESVYFDYFFIYGMFTCLDLNEIMDKFEKVKEAPAYALNVEAKEARKNLNMMAMIYLQALIQMKDFPETIGPILLSRSLCFNKKYKYFTKFIEECDKYNHVNCALTVAYQYMQPVGNETIFTLEKHNSAIIQSCIGGDNDAFVFSLSEDINVVDLSSVCVMDHIKLSKHKEAYTNMLIYSTEELSSDKGNSKLELMNGGIILSNERKIYSLRFNKSVCFQKAFDSEVIKSVRLLTPKHILIAYKDRCYLDIMHIYTGETIMRKSFNRVIQVIQANTHKEFINNFADMKSAKFIFLTVALKGGSVEIFIINLENIKIELNDEESSDNKLQMKLWKEIPQAGIDCVGIKFTFEENYDFETSEVCLTYDDGSFCFVSLSLSKEPVVEKEDDQTLSSIQVCRRKLQKSNHALRLCDYDPKDELYLFLTAGGSILVFDKKKQPAKIYQIDGSFDNVRFMKPQHILGFRKGTLQLFSISMNEDKSLSYVLTKTLDIHFDYITFLFVKESSMLLTTSKDSALKVSIVNSLHASADRIEFDRSEGVITELVEIDSSTLASKAAGSDTIDFWNLSTGKIKSSISVDLQKNETVSQLFHVINDRLVTISWIRTWNHRGGSHYTYYIRGYHFKAKNPKEVNFTCILEGVQNAKIFQPTILAENFVILSQSRDNYEINIHEFNFTEMKTKMICKLEINQPKSVFKFSEHILTTSNDEKMSLLENACMASAIDQLRGSRNLFVFFIHGLLVIFDPKQKKILKTKSFLVDDQSLDYFLSPTHISCNSLFNMKSFTSTFSLVCMNNLNDLVYIDYDAKNDKLNVVTSLNTNRKYDRSILEINNSTTDSDSRLIAAYDRVENRLVIHDVRVLQNAMSFRSSTKFSVPLNDSNLNMMGFSSDSKYVYTIQDNKILRFYSVGRNMKLIAQLPLYGPPICCYCTDEFMTVSMVDNRIISFLITDPDVPSQVEKISKLESRTGSDENFAKVIKNAELNIELLESSEDESWIPSVFKEEDDEERENLADLRKELEELREDLKTGKETNEEKFLKMERKILTIENTQKMRKKTVTKKPVKLMLFSDKIGNLRTNWLIDILKSIGIVLENLLNEKEYEKISENLAFNEDIVVASEKGSKNADDEVDIVQFKKDLVVALTQNQSDIGQLRTVNSGRSVKIINSHNSSACLIQ